MAKIKEKKEVKEKVEEIPSFMSGYVTTLEELSVYLKDHKLTPIEKYFAMRLLLEGYPFFLQEKIELPDDWSINGSKYFVADFFIVDMNLIIETEGKIHQQPEVMERDRNRFNVLQSLGYRVMRFSWDDVFQKNEDYDVFILVDHLKEQLEQEEDFKEISREKN